jgi:hypothetical protein
LYLDELAWSADYVAMSGQDPIGDSARPVTVSKVAAIVGAASLRVEVPDRRLHIVSQVRKGAATRRIIDGATSSAHMA